LFSNSALDGAKWRHLGLQFLETLLILGITPLIIVAASDSVTVVESTPVSSFCLVLVLLVDLTMVVSGLVTHLL
jgi:hypothetical protein